LRASAPGARAGTACVTSPPTPSGASWSSAATWPCFRPSRSRTRARAALAVDADPAILEAAAKVAAAFGVAPEFRRVDFDRDSGWEDQLEAFRPDVVVALSVLHWVEDQARFLAFLGRFDEVVFEGHDSSRIERERLRQAGFAAVDLVDTSERGRPILLARKR
jgi:hypothetical protein